MEVLISWSLDDLLIVHGRARPNCIDSVSLVVLVPGPTVFLPDSMLDPLLDMVVEEVGLLLVRHPAFNVLVLHLLDDLDGVVGD